MDRRGWSAARLQQQCPQLLHHPLAGEQFGGDGDHETGGEAAADPRPSRGAGSTWNVAEEKPRCEPGRGGVRNGATSAGAHCRRPEAVDADGRVATSAVFHL